MGTIYNQIPDQLYSKYIQLLLKDVLYEFPQNTTLGFTCYNILRNVIIFYQHDYAAFLAHMEKWQQTGNNMDSIHLGLKVAQDFTTFWDYMAFQINMIFCLNIEEDKIAFNFVLNRLRKISNNALSQSIDNLKSIYNKEESFRKRYRNTFTHRYHDVFFQRNKEDTYQGKLEMLSTELETSYNNMISGLNEFRIMINNHSPNTNTGYFLKEGIKYNIGEKRKKKKNKK